MTTAGVTIDLGTGHATVGDRVLDVTPAGEGLSVGTLVIRPLTFGERLRVVTSSADPAALAAAVLRAAVVRGEPPADLSRAAVEALALHLAGARLDAEPLAFADALGTVTRVYGWSATDVAEAHADLIDRLAQQVTHSDDGWTHIVLAAGPQNTRLDAAAVRDGLATDLLRRGGGSVAQGAAAVGFAGAPEEAVGPAGGSAGTTEGHVGVEGPAWAAEEVVGAIGGFAGMAGETAGSTADETGRVADGAAGAADQVAGLTARPAETAHAGGRAAVGGQAADAGSFDTRGHLATGAGWSPPETASPGGGNGLTTTAAAIPSFDAPAHIAAGTVVNDLTASPGTTHVAPAGWPPAQRSGTADASSAAPAVTAAPTATAAPAAATVPAGASSAAPIVAATAPVGAFSAVPSAAFAGASSARPFTAPAFAAPFMGPASPAALFAAPATALSDAPAASAAVSNLPAAASSATPPAAEQSIVDIADRLAALLDDEADLRGVMR